MSNALRIYRATVVSVDDPQGLGRVLLSQVRPLRGVATTSQGWAAVVATPLGPSAELRPCFAVGDPVLYAAERLPFVGAVVLGRVQSGTGPALLVQAQGDALQITAPAGHRVLLQADGAVEVAASQVHISAGMLTVDAGMSKFSGVVKCDTLITNTVVAATYTPGAGNLV